MAIDLFGPDGQALTTMSCPDAGNKTVADCAQNAVFQAEDLGFSSSNITFGSTAVSSDVYDPSTQTYVPDPSNQCAAWANLQNFSVNYNLAGFIWFDINTGTAPNGTQYALSGYCSP